MSKANRNKIQKHIEEIYKKEELNKSIEKLEKSKKEWIKDNLQKMGKNVEENELEILLTLHEFMKEFEKHYYKKYTKEKVIEKRFEILYYSLEYYKQNHKKLALMGRSGLRQCIDYGVQKVFGKS